MDELYPEYSHKDREACPTINARVIAIRNKRSTSNLFSNLNPKYRNSFIAYKTDHRCGSNDPKMSNSLRVKEAID